MEIAVIRKVLILLAMAMITPILAQAQEQHPDMLLKQHSLVIRDSIASFEYDAGGTSVDGILHGPAATYTYHDAYYPLMARAELEILFGFTDYDRGQVSENSSEFIVNTRGLIGYDMLYHDNLVLTPYTGLGFRHWNSEADGSQAPEVTTSYVYIPIGVETQSSLAPSIDFGTRMELDLIMDGTATTDFGSGQDQTGEAINDLDFGYGLRLSAYVVKQFEAVGVGFEPFIRYWNVDSSAGDWVRHSDNSFERYSLPHSTTFIWGASLTVHF